MLHHLVCKYVKCVEKALFCKSGHIYIKHIWSIPATELPYVIICLSTHMHAHMHAPCIIGIVIVVLKKYCIAVIIVLPPSTSCIKVHDYLWLGLRK